MGARFPRRFSGARRIRARDEAVPHLSRVAAPAATRPAKASAAGCAGLPMASNRRPAFVSHQ
jgi:hypothetical protein